MIAARFEDLLLNYPNLIKVQLGRSMSLPPSGVEGATTAPSMGLYQSLILVSTVLPKILDEEVVKLHLSHVNGELSKLTPVQAEYLGLEVEGPFKPEMVSPLFIH